MTTTNTNQLTCKNNNCAKPFIVIPQEEKFYQQKGLPLPDHCPSCRHKQRMALRSERKMYKRCCGKCQNATLAVYPKSAPYKVYCQQCFWENVG